MGVENPPFETLKMRLNGRVLDTHAKEGPGCAGHLERVDLKARGARAARSAGAEPAVAGELVDRGVVERGVAAARCRLANAEDLAL